MEVLLGAIWTILAGAAWVIIIKTIIAIRKFEKNQP